ncbi:dienelactone hydrolase [Ephemerocybe angulata]|uniref:Dienelactone hydrolase n=1 Tax=Ephemerocybe angulata TaxID=980116 RepID=A0A8H6ILF7_9AGAR|nr:dienelactone hydrolase [Tulosesus angulatus]
MLSRLRSVVAHLSPISSTARMSTVHNTNKACCTIPPVQSDYQPKGTFKSIGDFKKVYVTGPEKSDNAIVCVYDIFGYFPQTQQGADIVAASTCTTVYMPDFFEPEGPFDINRYPPKTEEDKKAIQDFFGGTANPSAAISKLTKFGEHLKSNGAQKVAVYGFCWGGKVVISSSGENTPFSAAAIIHPAMLSVEDAKKLTIPLGIYVSADEPEAEYESIVDIISKKPFASVSDHKNYKNMFHGWAAARGDLKNEENRKEYDDVYKRLVTFFQKAL